MVARVCAIHGLYAGPACPTCEASRPTSKPTHARSAADRIRSTSRWQRTRARVLERDGRRCTYGLYADDDRRGLPEEGCCRATMQLDVHHVTPIEDGGDPYDDANLRTLCARHHAIVERSYRRRRDTADGYEVEIEV